MRLRVAVLALTAAAAFGASTHPATARERPTGVFIPGVVEPPPLGLALHDAVISATDRGIGSLEPVGVNRRRIRTSDGLAVTVKTSPRYVPDAKYDERLVGFLDSLLHGAELGGLKVYVAPPKEIANVCGGAAAACYAPETGTMFIVGRSSYGGVPTSYVVAHEYGHRIAQFRKNTPFPGGAFNWGTKRWASVQHVCEGVEADEYFPGNEGRHYFSNPGEAFADSYAWSQIGRPPDGWRWAHSLRPTPEALAAVRADVAKPWRAVRLERRGRLTAERRRHVYTLSPKWDGQVLVRMTGGPGDLDLKISDGAGDTLRSARPGTSREKINGTLCGDRKLTLVVSGSGRPARYRLEIEIP